MGGKGSGGAGKIENLGKHAGTKRKKHGATNRLSRQAIKAAMATGELPAAGLLRIFRFHMARADILMRKTVLTEAEEKKLEDVLERARVAAKEAAPYYHARLTAHKISGQLDLAEFDPKRLSDEQLFSLMDRIRGLITSLEDGRYDEDDPAGVGEGGGAPEDEEGGPLLEIPARPGQVHRA